MAVARIASSSAFAPETSVARIASSSAFVPDGMNRSISSASASIGSIGVYRWNPYNKTCPKSIITPESTGSPNASPVNLNFDPLIVPHIAFPFPIDLSPRAWEGTKVFAIQPRCVDEQSERSESTATLQSDPVHDEHLSSEEASEDSAPAKVIDYRNYGIKVTKSQGAYREFARRVPLNRRKATDPQTPRPSTRCSRKQWGIQMKQWRQALEAYRH